ncbi:hypothetical protein QE152_g10618 [Popillia japonica]|uniref:THAP-type domain-containing protein n=1 Tax=Popillia japonica TaxID=7064 RepID=A0AAW1LU83_POPJA
MACAVNGCKNVKRFKPKGVTFYRFPTGSLLKEWLRVLDKGMPTLKLLSQASGSCTDQPSISSQSSTEVTRKPVKQKFKRPLGISTSGSSTDSSGRKKVKFIDVQHSILPRKQNFEFSSEETSLVNPYRSSPQKKFTSEKHWQVVVVIAVVKEEEQLNLFSLSIIIIYHPVNSRNN